jgi:hypothetical protein
MEITVNPEFIDIINEALEVKQNRHIELKDVQSLEISNRVLIVRLTNMDVISFDLSIA